MGAEPSSTPRREGRRFAILIALGLVFAVVQTWFMPSGRTPSLARTTAENAYAMARETPQQVSFAQLNDGKWQTAQLYAPGADLMAACNALSAGQEDCRTALAKPPKAVVLLGLRDGKLNRIEQLPANLLVLQHCGETVQAGTTAQLLRKDAITLLDCRTPAP